MLIISHSVCVVCGTPCTLVVRVDEAHVSPSDCDRCGACALYPVIWWPAAWWPEVHALVEFGEGQIAVGRDPSGAESEV